MNFDYSSKKHKITKKYVAQIRIYGEFNCSVLRPAWRPLGLMVEGEAVRAKQNYV